MCSRPSLLAGDCKDDKRGPVHQNKNSHVLLRQIQTAYIRKECCSGPKRGGRIQMYRSRKLSGVCLKTTGILEQKKPTEANLPTIIIIIIRLYVQQK